MLICLTFKHLPLNNEFEWLHSTKYNNNVFTVNLCTQKIPTKLNQTSQKNICKYFVSQKPKIMNFKPKKSFAPPYHFNQSTPWGAGPCGPLP